tara:strand:- start:5250 stop:5423 length:174 start_codon:yes stop_codon:yes gene_type:complete
MKNYEIEMQADKLKFQEKRIDDLEEKLVAQRALLDKQIKEIEGWKKRHLLDPSGKMM